MAQHDYNLANQSGADFRADLNNALSAIATTNSGATSPSTTFAHQLWVDTANSVLKIRNSANDAWITTGVSITADNTFDINGGTVNGITSFSFSTGSTVTSILDEDDLSSDSVTALATQQSIKAYVDSQVATVDTLAEILLNGNSTGGTDISLSSSDITGTGNINITGTIQSSGTITGNLTGDVTGNASTATALETARTINGTSFDGTANISFDTDSVSEGSSNLYFTNARVESYLDAGTSTPTFASAVINSSVTGSAVLDDDTFGTASATTVATSESIKAYVDSQVGSVDTLAEILLNGNTTGGTDIEFGDNDKAIFGTDSDLQIYHDGFHSRIKDAGTGNLVLNATNLVVNNSADSANMLKAIDGGAVTLYHNGSQKLATTSTGIDVTGTVTSDGLAVNSGTTDTVATFQSSDQFADIKLQDSGGSSFIRQSNGSLIFEADRDNAASSSALIFKIDGSNVGRFTSNGRLGIGTTVPDNLLDVRAAENIQLKIASTTASNNARMVFAPNNSEKWNMGVNISNNDFTFYDVANGTSPVRFEDGAASNTLVVDSNSRVGIGTTSPDRLLDIEGSVPAVRLNDTSLTGMYHEILGDGNSLSIEADDGNVGSSSSINFKVDGNEKARINSDGYLLVNKTSSGISTAGALFSNVGSHITRDGGSSLSLNRLTSDGAILDIRKDGSTVGSIGANAGVMTLASPNGNKHYVSNSALFPSANNILDLGVSSQAYKDLYLSGRAYVGTIEVAAPADQGVKISSSSPYLFFNDTDTANVYDSSISQSGATLNIGGATPAQTLKFRNKASFGESARITTSGQLLIGKTATDNTTVGTRINGAGFISSVVDGDNALLLNRLNSDGSIVLFRKDGSTVGSIGAYNSATAILSGSAASYSGLYLNTNKIEPVGNNFGSEIRANDTIDIGSSTYKFKDLYLSGSASSVGGEINTNSGSNPLYVTRQGNTNESLKIHVSDSAAIFESIQDETADNYGAFIFAMDDGVTEPFFDIRKGTASSGSKFYVDGSGNVGIGTSSPLATLHVGSGSGSLNTAAELFIPNNDALMRQIKLGHGSGVANITADDSSKPITLSAGGSERARIDSSGHFLVATTNASNTVAGFRAYSGGNIGIAINGQSAEFNRLDSNGNILEFKKDGTNIGYIGSEGGNTFYIVNDDTGIRFAGGSDVIVPCGANGASSDNLISLGLSVLRFKDLHLGGTGYFGTSVGIGTTSTDAPLTVHNSSDPEIRFGYSSTQDHKISWDSSKVFIEADPENVNGNSAIGFRVDGSEKARIDSSGNVGIGETSPQNPLHVRSDSASGENYAIQIDNNNTTVGSQIGMLFRSRVGTTNTDFSIRGIANGADDMDLTFNSDGGSERLRIDSSGNVGIGTTHPDSKLDVTGGDITVNVSATGLMNYKYNNSVVGSITTNGISTAFNTSSDARLKDVTGEARGLEVITKLNPVAYNWKADGKADEGLIAQEVKEIVPNAVSGSEDEHYQMDYSKLVTHLVAGMKEQQEQIESLKSEIAKLKGE